MNEQEAKSAFRNFIVLLNTSDFGLSNQCKSKIKELITFWNSKERSFDEHFRIRDEVHPHITTELSLKGGELNRLWTDYIHKILKYRTTLLSSYSKEHLQELHESIINSAVEKSHGKSTDHCVICGDTDNIVKKYGRFICKDCMDIQRRMHGTSFE
jgi:hypothetical protein